jgi:hypothetical protein
VELLALVPAFLLLGLICWLILASASAWLNAAGAARTGARAAAVGEPARAAVARVVRTGGADGARVVELDEGTVGPRVRVTVRAPRASGVPSLGWLGVEAEAGR